MLLLLNFILNFTIVNLKKCSVLLIGIIMKDSTEAITIQNQKTQGKTESI